MQKERRKTRAVRFFPRFVISIEKIEMPLESGSLKIKTRSVKDNRARLHSSRSCNELRNELYPDPGLVVIGNSFHSFPSLTCSQGRRSRRSGRSGRG